MHIAEYFDSVASFWDDDFAEARAARIVASTLLIPRGGACVLDVGCGSGSMFLDLMEAGACEIEGVDLSRGQIPPPGSFVQFDDNSPKKEGTDAVPPPETAGTAQILG